MLQIIIHFEQSSSNYCKYQGMNVLKECYPLPSKTTNIYSKIYFHLTFHFLHINTVYPALKNIYFFHFLKNEIKEITLYRFSPININLYNI